MAAARERAEWARTSSTMALYANCHRGPRDRAWEAREFDPTAARAREPLPVVGVEALRGLVRPA